MLVDKLVDTVEYSGFADLVSSLEKTGYDGLLLGERFDPFLPLVLAAEHSSRLTLATAVAIALPRSPTHVAYAAADLQQLSHGRFILGLGSQIRAHIERRFSSVWSKPVGQMREFVMAIHALYDSWESGSRIDFQGEHYSITLMTPYFSPDVSEYGRPPIWLGAVGPAMSAMAGEVADGVFLHPFTTTDHLRATTLPRIDVGRVRAGRPAPLQTAIPVLIAVGDEEEQVRAAQFEVRKQLAFYGSTPAYLEVLEAHGWAGLQPELNRLSKEGRWDAMAEVIDDSMLDAFAVSGSPEDVGRELSARYEGLVTRVSLYTPNYSPSDDVFERILDVIRRDPRT